MTLAICIKCGGTKQGALTSCRDCGFDPEDSEDKARSMIATDHFLSHEDLADIGERIRTGQPVHYPEDAVAKLLLEFEEGADKFPKMLVFGGLGLTLLLVVLMVAYFAVWGI